jgi:2-(3-amino-3-carboxypropyl)histidine synthase
MNDEIAKTREGSFNLELDQVITVIQERKCDTVGIQLPDGLRTHLGRILERIKSETEAEVIVSGSTCYGACDIDGALRSKVDVLFHFGHAEIAADDKIVFIEARSNADVGVVEEAVHRLEGSVVGVLATVQHVHKLDEICRILEEHGKTAVIGDGDAKIKYPGQVLGCDFSAAHAVECDEYLIVCSGDFHPLGVALSTGKRVVVADPLLGEVREPSVDRFIRRRYAGIARAQGAHLWGVLLGVKRHQQRHALAKELVHKIEKHNLDAYLIMVDAIGPETLASFKADAFVNTACPRIGIDDAARYDRPVLTPVELEIVLLERDDYSF